MSEAESQPSAAAVGEPDFEATAKRLSETRSKVVLTSVGPVLIYPVEASVLLATQGGLIDLAQLDVTGMTEEQLESKSQKLLQGPQGPKVMARVENLLRKAIAKPKLYDDPSQGPTLAQFPIFDQLEMFAECMRLSGYTKEKAAKVSP